MGDTGRIVAEKLACISAEKFLKTYERMDNDAMLTLLYSLPDSLGIR
jgi:hypothetical protein